MATVTSSFYTNFFAIFLFQVVSQCLSFFLVFLHLSISVSVSVSVPLSLLSSCSPPLSALPLICPSFSSRLCGLCGRGSSEWSGLPAGINSTALGCVGVCVCLLCVILAQCPGLPPVVKCTLFLLSSLDGCPERPSHARMQTHRNIFRYPDVHTDVRYL